MRKVIVGLLLPGVCCTSAMGVLIGGFSDTDRFINTAKDIFVAECTSVPPAGTAHDGIYAVDVKVLRVLKGIARPGELRIATIYRMKPGTKYLLSDSEGKALGTNFLFARQL